MKEKQKSNKGFTLIEMLVVVLIIGILAAIALPQYKNAVRKSRVAEAQIALRAIIDATDRYYLARDAEHTVQLKEIDIDVQTDTNNWDFVIEECDNGGTDLTGCLATAAPKWEEGWFIFYASSSYAGGGWVGNGKFICSADSAKGHQICKSLGGTVLEGYDDYYQI